MSIFGNLFGKKIGKSHGGCLGASLSETPVCDCGKACKAASSANDGGAVLVKVMGSGCKKCRQLYENALAAADRLDRAVQVEYVTDIAEIAAAGVMVTPALSVAGKVVSSGKILTVAEIEEMLK